MERSKFYSYNWFTQDATDYTYNSSQVDSFFPISNLKSPFSTKVMRTMPGITTFQFIADIKSFPEIDTCLIKGHAIDGLNIFSILIEGSGTLDFNTPAITATMHLDLVHNFGYSFFNGPYACRYWRFTVTTAGSWVELSNIFLGKGTYLEQNNPDYGWQYQNKDNTKNEFNRYDQQYSDKLNSVKNMTVKFNYLNKAELKTLDEIFEAHGTFAPLWFILDPDAVTYDDIELFAGQFYFDEKPAIENSGFGLYNTQIKLRECV